MKYEKLADKRTLDKTVKALGSKGYKAFVIENRTDALKKIRKLIPNGASVMNGSSVSLEEIGYIELLNSGKHGWIDLHKKVSSENDPVKRAALRKKSVLSDYYLGSVHALTENGEFVIASNTGSQMPHVVYTSPNLIFVVSTKKIVPTMSDAMKRLEKYVVPLENKRSIEKYGGGTSLNKIVIFKNENPGSKRKIYFILVKESLGF